MKKEKQLSVTSVMNEIDSEIKAPFSPKHPDYWNMLSEIILECQRLRFEKNISQKLLSEKMETKQSVISRFENMGRKPNYDFLVRLAHELGCNPKMYLDGDFSVQVPYELREKLLEIAEQKNVDIEKYLTDCISSAINEDYIEYSSTFFNGKEYQNNYDMETLCSNDYIAFNSESLKNQEVDEAE